MFPFGIPQLQGNTQALYQSLAAQLAGSPGIGLNVSSGLGLGLGHGTGGLLDPGLASLGNMSTYGMPDITPPMHYGGNSMAYVQQSQNMHEGQSAFWKTRMCVRWKEGKCLNSATCKYAHGEQELRVLSQQEIEMALAEQARKASKPAIMPAPKDADKMREVMRKTKLCGEFMSGNCSRGTTCNYAHGVGELRPQPVFTTKVTTGTTQNKDGTARKRGCVEFNTKGTCMYGDKCKYAHGFSESPSRGGMSLASDGGLSEQTTQTGKRGAVHMETEVNVLKRPNTSALTSSRTSSEGANAPLSHPDCPFCLYLASVDKEEVLKALQNLGNTKVTQVGVMLVAGCKTLGNMWANNSPANLRSFLARSGAGIMARISLLRSLAFHVHDRGDGSYDSSRYQEAGLNENVADFLLMCMDGQEGEATMDEYFKMLEVVKELFDIDDDQYYNVSAAVASFMMNQ